MANDSNGNSWVLDTAEVIKTTPIGVRRMEWRPNAASDSLIVKDSTGKVKWTKTALAAGGGGGDEVYNDSGPPVPFNGFDLDTIGGGTLYVEVV